MPKCPHCGRAILHVDLKGVEVHVAGKNRWNGTSYYCPHCQGILSVAIDPVALKADIIDGVVAEVKKLFGR